MATKNLLVVVKMPLAIVAVCTALMVDTSLSTKRSFSHDCKQGALAMVRTYLNVTVF
jgi:hypothetical protein